VEKAGRLFSERVAGVYSFICIILFQITAFFVKFQTVKLINRYLDHTLLRPEATEIEIDKLIEETLAFKFAALCVHPLWVKKIAAGLNGSAVGVCTVVGFPLGSNLTETKAKEAELALSDGATELDMVLPIGLLKAGNWRAVYDDIHQVVEAAPSLVIKVILETCYLSNEEIVQGCELSVDAGAHFVKTSTGFGPGGATVEAVKLMRRTVGEKFGVKASGGIRNYQTALALIEAGANRIGSSSSVAICSSK